MLSVPVSPGDLRILRLVLLLLLALLAVRLFFIGIARPGVKGLKGGLSSGLLFVFLALLVLEVIFLFVARSHQTWETYAGTIWRKRHWQENEAGFRDGDWNAKLKAQGKKILLLGDSFTAGAGIARPEDRFSDQLAQGLGDGYQVFNAGYPGWGPERQFEALQDFPTQPDLVVLAWYVNDIHGALNASGTSQDEFSRHGARRSKKVLSLTDGSYLGNFLYWLYPHDAAHGNYMDFLRSGFERPEVLQTHFEALDRIESHCRSRQIPFAVMLFPLLRDVQGSHFAVDPLVDHWARKGVPCLSLIPLLVNATPEDLVVNANDAHPNEAVHQKVAQALAAFFKEQKLLPLP